VRELLRRGGGGARVYPEIEKLLLDFFPGATDALVYNHDVFDKDYAGDRTEDQDKKNPGVNARYANIVHNDLNDNSGRVRCRELLTKNLRNFGREQHYTDEEADAKMSRRFMSINLAKPMETVEQFPFVLCAWPSFADQPYITNYRIYDDRSARPRASPTGRPRVVLVPQADADRGLDAQVLRLGDRRLGVALVVPHRPASTRPRPPTHAAARTWSSGPTSSSSGRLLLSRTKPSAAPAG